jgi:hypothetical protein
MHWNSVTLCFHLSHELMQQFTQAMATTSNVEARWGTRAKEERGCWGGGALGVAMKKKKKKKKKKMMMMMMLRIPHPPLLADCRRFQATLALLHTLLILTGWHHHHHHQQQQQRRLRLQMRRRRPLHGLCAGRRARISAAAACPLPPRGTWYQ